MYWHRDQEITLLHLVLEALDPAENRGHADMIVSGLIEMELVDAERAPRAQQAWQDEWEDFDVPRDFVAKHYVTADEEEMADA